MLTKYKLVIGFGILSIGYIFYLDFSDGSKHYPDYMTHLAGKQTESILAELGYRTNIVPHTEKSSLMVFVNQKYLARIIEGCNGMSVIILLIAFVVAFSDTFKRTFLFILASNVLFMLLTIGLYNYPWRSEVMHKVIFPIGDLWYGLFAMDVFG